MALEEPTMQMKMCTRDSLWKATEREKESTPSINIIATRVNGAPICFKARANSIEKTKCFSKGILLVGSNRGRESTSTITVTSSKATISRTKREARGSTRLQKEDSLKHNSIQIHRPSPRLLYLMVQCTWESIGVVPGTEREKIRILMDHITTETGTKTISMARDSLSTAMTQGITVTGREI